MRISILTTKEPHPILPHLEAWQARHSQQHDIVIAKEPTQVTEGDILFLISCPYVVDADIRTRFEHVLVVHASNLPRGRGWSPHIWQILEGSNEITLTLLEAEDKIDSGDIWLQEQISLAGTELFNEINEKLFSATIKLMDMSIVQNKKIYPRAQASEEGTYYQRRSPKDSAIDPHRSIAEQFDLLRVADPNRFPAYFDYRGQRYTLKIEKASDKE